MNDQTPQTERHWHWEFWAHNGSDSDVKSEFAILVTVFGYESETDAEIGARAIVTRSVFKLVRVWQCSTCGYQGQMLAVHSKMADKLG